MGIDLPTSTLNRTLVSSIHQNVCPLRRGDLQNYNNNSVVRIEPRPSTSGINNDDVVRIEPCAGTSTSGVNINDGGGQEMSSLRL